MEIEYDLATLAEDLAKEITEVSELYLFGSRARGTQSTRSDADVLVVVDEHIKPNRLREFSFANCEALDLFIVDGGKAISSQNESFIEAEDFPSLLALLGAVKIWSRNEGRAKAGIEWRFKVREDVEFVPTALPNTDRNSRPSPRSASELTVKDILNILTVPQLRSIVLTIVGVLGAVGAASFWVGSNIDALSSNDKKVVVPDKATQRTPAPPRSPQKTEKQ